MLLDNDLLKDLITGRESGVFGIAPRISVNGEEPLMLM